jgi:selenium metabolism protein YedF
MNTVDAKGLLCPQPLILTKKALAELQLNEEMIVWIDNEISKNNVERFLRDNNIKVNTTSDNGIYKLQVTKTADILISPKAEEYCEPSVNKIENHVLVFKNDKIADDELGEILTKAYFDIINEMDSLPGKIIFYHRGIKLTLKDSLYLEHLKELESLGVKILICGTCVNFYKAENQVGVGIVSNAYEILTALSEAHHIITL